MLFNSAQFIFGFLPAVLIGFFLLGWLGFRQAAIGWVFLGSLVFYGWDNPWRLLPLILASATFNFIVGRAMMSVGGPRLLYVGVGGNLLLLGVFKYAAFVLTSIETATGLAMPHFDIPLPIGISFYTFTQIAFLVDVHRKVAREYQPLKYGLFVTYFPHLIAGPILHHKEMMPQFDNPEIFRPRLTSLLHGLAWFSAGLFKKVIFADGIAAYVDAPMKAAAAGSVGFGDAWVGILSYTLQIYFDFSGYSDMAIGLALMMGITFPLNFDSPYKATSPIDFWRRWHMTLSRFLRDYLYIPLGGNRKGPLRRHLNLLITMVLGGLWHGASWNFAIWGAIHGLGLLFNHRWRDVAARIGIVLPREIGWAMTIVLVIFAWVPFRADTLHASLTLWQTMLGLHGFAMPTLVLSSTVVTETGFAVTSTASVLTVATWIAGLFAIALFAPNTQEIFALDWRSLSPARLRWRPSAPWAIAAGSLFGIAVAGMISKPTVFLYFRF
jgi:D-alanyl-lipoteichoic acid acyltransferase DltB (MBOAT superfamily)